MGRTACAANCGLLDRSNQGPACVLKICGNNKSEKSRTKLGYPSRRLAQGCHVGGGPKSKQSPVVGPLFFYFFFGAVRRYRGIRVLEKADPINLMVRASRNLARHTLTGSQ